MPLPLVPATWITGGKRILWIAKRGKQPLNAVQARGRSFRV